MVVDSSVFMGSCMMVVVIGASNTGSIVVIGAMRVLVGSMVVIGAMSVLVGSIVVIGAIKVVVGANFSVDSNVVGDFRMVVVLNVLTVVDNVGDVSVVVPVFDNGLVSTAVPFLKAVRRGSIFFSFLFTCIGTFLIRILSMALGKARNCMGFAMLPGMPPTKPTSFSPRLIMP